MAVANLDLKAREVMNTRVVAARRDTTGHDIAFQLLSGMESGLPVLEGDKKIIGVVTQFDLLKALEEGQDLDSIKAQDIMTTPPITVSEDTSIKDIIALMRTERIHGVPVVRNGKLVGTVFRGDLLSHLVAPDMLAS